MPDLNGRPDQWFLDLDGVRSGPYQTPEVLSLIAEGEVLPHHRISVGLKDAEWSSILDWRMALSRSPQPIPQVSSFQTNFEASPSRVQPVPTPSEVHEILSAELTHDLSPSLEDFQELDLSPEVNENSAPPVRNENVPPKTSFVRKEEISAPEETIENNREILDSEEGTSTAKRDPMAEMFDVLQSTKQRREAKSQLANQVQSQQSVEKATAREEGAKNSSMAKTLAIGGAIVLGGFVLGQVFQGAAPPANQALNAKPSATPFVTDSTASSPKAESGDTEVVDRSNDKMIIRGRVEKKTEQQPQPRARQAAPKPGTKEYKEAEELKQLKQELQELKAMKNYPLNGGDIGSDPENVNNVQPEEDDGTTIQPNPNDTRMVNPNYVDPNQQPGYPNGNNPYGAPYNGNGQPVNPRGGAQNPNSNVHY